MLAALTFIVMHTHFQLLFVHTTSVGESTGASVKKKKVSEQFLRLARPRALVKAFIDILPSERSQGLAAGVDRETASGHNSAGTDEVLVRHGFWLGEADCPFVCRIRTNSRPQMWLST